eukprot:jgi/Chlat1/5387/Chrsp35S05218
MMMEPIGLPPSPNWYGAHLADWGGPDGAVYAYAARNVIAVMLPSQLKWQGILSGHKDRVTAVASLKNASNVLVSGSMDKTIKVWNTRTMKLLHTLRGHKAPVAAVTTSVVTPETFFSGDSEGAVHCWQAGDSDRSSSVSFCPQVDAIVAMAASPQSTNVVAVGYQNGSLLLVDMTTCTTVHRLLDSAAQVHAMAWQGSLLAASRRDCAVRIWRCNDDVQSPPVLKHVTRLPGPPSGVTDAQKERLWVALAWVPAASEAAGPRLICSAHMGTLFLLETPASENARYPPIVRFPPGHSRTVFSVCASGDGRYLMTTSMDRSIVLWNVEEKACVWSILGLGSYVYSMSVSPSHKVAVACGDNTIRVWNPSDPNNPYHSILLWRGLQSKVTAVAWHPTQEDVIAFGTASGHVGYCDVRAERSTIAAAKHVDAVTDLSWRVTKQVEVPNTGIESTTSSQADVVQAILYSYGNDGTLFEWPAELQTNSRPRDMRTSLSLDVSTTIATAMAWNDNGRLLAVGFSDGAVDVWAPEGAWYSRVNRFRDHTKGITRVQWQPRPEAMTVDASAASTHGLLLASASNDGSLRVYDTSRQYDSSSKGFQREGCIQLLQGHKKRVLDMSWSPHNATVLASCSADGTAMVWSIDQDTSMPVATLQGHDGKVLTVRWSLADPKLLFSGGEDQVLRVWDVTSPKHTPPPPSQSTDLVAESATTSSHKSALDSRVASQNEASAQAVAERGDALTPNGVESRQADDDDATLEVNEPPPSPQAAKSKPTVSANKQRKRKMDGSKSLLPAAPDTTADTQRTGLNACLLLAEQLFPAASASGDSAPTVPPELDALGLCVDAEEMLALILEQESRLAAGIVSAAEEEQAVKSAQRSAMLSIWRGDVRTAIEMLLKANALTGDWVSVSVSAGRSAWEQVSRAYAQVLEERGELHSAVMHLLAVQDVHAAVNVYRRAGLFRDALAVAAARLLPADPLVAQVHQEQAADFEKKGEYEKAAASYVAAKQPLQAVHALSRRQDKASLKGAAVLAVRLQAAQQLYINNSALQYVICQYASACQAADEWDEAQNILNAWAACSDEAAASALPWQLVFSTEQVLVDVAGLSGQQRSDAFQQDAHGMDALQQYSPHAYDWLHKSWLEPGWPNPPEASNSGPPASLKTSKATFGQLYARWLELHPKFFKNNPRDHQTSPELPSSIKVSDGRSKCKLRAQIAQQFAHGFMALCTDRPLWAYRSWLTALDTCYRAGDHAALDSLCEVIAPHGDLHLAVGAAAAFAAVRAPELVPDVASEDSQSGARGYATHIVACIQAFAGFNQLQHVVTNADLVELEFTELVSIADRTLNSAVASHVALTALHASLQEKLSPTVKLPAIMAQQQASSTQSRLADLVCSHADSDAGLLLAMVDAALARQQGGVDHAWTDALEAERIGLALPPFSRFPIKDVDFMQRAAAVETALDELQRREGMAIKLPHPHPLLAAAHLADMLVSVDAIAATAIARWGLEHAYTVAQRKHFAVVYLILKPVRTSFAVDGDHVAVQIECSPSVSALMPSNTPRQSPTTSPRSLASSTRVGTNQSEGRQQQQQQQQEAAKSGSQRRQYAAKILLALRHVNQPPSKAAEARLRAKAAALHIVQPRPVHVEASASHSPVRDFATSSAAVMPITSNKGTREARHKPLRKYTPEELLSMRDTMTNGVESQQAHDVLSAVMSDLHIAAEHVDAQHNPMRLATGRDQHRSHDKAAGVVREYAGAEGNGG